MKSFKKIAMVTAAALTSTMFIVTSSHAAPLAVTVAGNANTTTSAAPQTVAVPSTNVIDAARTVAIAATADTGTGVTFTASPSVKLVSALNTVDAPKTVSSGVSSLSLTSAGTVLTVYAYTTTTAVGSVTVTNGAYSTIVYLAGLAGSASNVSVSVPSSTAVGTVPTISVSTTDAFGNPVGGESVSITLIGSTFTGGSISSSVVTSAVTNAATGAVLGTGTATLSTAVAGEITVVATGVSAAPTVSGLAVPVKAAIAKFVVSDLSAEIAKLKAELAAEKASHEVTKAAAAASDAKAKAEAVLAKQAADKSAAEAVAVEVAKAKAASDLAVAVYKAEYNALATKWNKKFPKLKVALKK